MKKLLLSLGLLAAANACSAQAPQYKERLDSFLNALDASHKSMVSVAITNGGRTEYSRAIGDANVEKRQPADTTTIYRIGSISKMFTAVMIFQLIQEGKLSLETHLDHFFSQIPEAKAITIAQMLRHNSGIFSFTEDTAYSTWSTRPQTREAMLARISAFKPAFAPGAKYEYSNTNFVLLAYIVETLTGKPYKDALAERITRRIPLHHTFNGDAAAPGAALALSYSKSGDGWDLEDPTEPSVSTGAGSVVSTPADLDRFITALFAGRLVSEASLKQMTTIKEHYGMGIFTIPFGELKGFGHTGRIDGFTSVVSYFPTNGVAMALTLNGQNYPMNDIAIGVLSIYFGKKFTIPDFKKMSVNAITAGLKPEVLNSYAGEYSSAQVPLKITVSVKDGVLWAQATGQDAFPLTAESSTQFSFDAAGIVLNFAPDKKMILHQGGANLTFTK